MTIVLATQAGDPFGGSARVNIAETVLRALGVVTRSRARVLLEGVALFTGLAEAELTAVLDRFLPTEGRGHALWPVRDEVHRRFVWQCTAGDLLVFQPFGAAVPPELRKHPHDPLPTATSPTPSRAGTLLTSLPEQGVPEEEPLPTRHLWARSKHFFGHPTCTRPQP